MEKLEPTFDERCGLYAGYKRHRKLNEQLCAPCREAMREYRRKTYDPVKQAKHKKQYIENVGEEEFRERSRQQQAKFLKAKQQTPEYIQKVADLALQKEQREQEKAQQAQQRLKDAEQRQLDREQARLDKQKAHKEAVEQRRIARRAQEIVERDIRRAEKRQKQQQAQQQAREQRQKEAQIRQQERKIAQQAEKQARKDAKKALKATQHGTTYGDYTRCKDSNGTACRPCKDAAAAYVRQYNKTHKRPSRGSKHGRKATVRKYYTVKHILKLYGATCHICNQPIDLTLPRHCGEPGYEMGLHLDHVIPLSKGGHDTRENVKPSHAKCNLQKSDQMPEKATLK